MLRKCREDESSLILGLINAAAEAYRGVSVVLAERTGEAWREV